MTFKDLKAMGAANIASIAEHMRDTEEQKKRLIELPDPTIVDGECIEYVVHIKGHKEIAPGFWGGDPSKPVDTTPQPIDGYYAKYQPHYHWSFTSNIQEANRYKSRKGAFRRAKEAQRCFECDAVTIQPVRVPKIRL